MSRLSRLAPLFALVLASSASFAQEPARLRWQFKTGDVLRYRMTVNLESEMSMLPGQKRVSDFGRVWRMEIKSVAADGSAQIDFAYEAVKIDFDAGTARRSFDSTRKDDAATQNDAAIGKVFAPILESHVQFKMDASGQVSDVKGLDEALAKSVALVGGGDLGLEQVVKQQFDNGSFRKMFDPGVLPDKALAAGETWQHSLEQPNGMVGLFKYAIDSKFEGPERHGADDCAKITQTSKLSITKGDPSKSPMHMELKDSSGQGKAVIWFATKSGRLIECQSSNDVSLDMVGAAQDASAGKPMEIHISTTSSSKIMLLAKDAPLFE